jgi:hypothetical protein
MSLSHAANTAVAAAATNAAVTAPLWPPPPRALVPLSARLEFAAQGFTAGQGASPNDLEANRPELGEMQRKPKWPASI